jgi:hypothetical protein
VLQSYKDLIRTQDQEMTLLKKQILELQHARTQQLELRHSPPGSGSNGLSSYSDPARVAELEGLLTQKVRKSPTHLRSELLRRENGGHSNS